MAICLRLQPRLCASALEQQDREHAKAASRVLREYTGSVTVHRCTTGAVHTSTRFLAQVAGHNKLEWLVHRGQTLQAALHYRAGPRIQLVQAEMAVADSLRDAFPDGRVHLCVVHELILPQLHVLHGSTRVWAVTAPAVSAVADARVPRRPRSGPATDLAETPCCMEILPASAQEPRCGGDGGARPRVAGTGPVIGRYTRGPSAGVTHGSPLLIRCLSARLVSPVAERLQQMLCCYCLPHIYSCHQLLS